MVEYLGGIKDPDIDVTKVQSPGWLCYDFLLFYRDYHDDGALTSCSISEMICSYEEITADSHRDYSLTWGTLGYLVTGPVGGLIGAVLGGKKTEKHIVFCELSNGWQLILSLNREEFRDWENIMNQSLYEKAK